MPVVLRPARGEDAAFLLRVRNDPATRAQSFDAGEIAWDAHVGWLARRLAQPAPHLYVVEAAGEPAGACRIDVRGDTGVVSIALAAEHRGRGLAAPALQALADAARAASSGLRRLVAYVRGSNPASLAAFRRAGYAGPAPCAAEADGPGQPPEACLRLEIALTP